MTPIDPIPYAGGSPPVIQRLCVEIEKLEKALQEIATMDGNPNPRCPHCGGYMNNFSDAVLVARQVLKGGEE